MSTLMHAFFRNPLLFTVAVLSLLIVVVVMLDAWFDRRRDRKLRETPGILSGQKSVLPLAASTRASQFRDKIFRGRFLLPGIILLTGLVLALRGKTDVAARARVHGDAAKNSTVAVVSDQARKSASLWYTNDPATPALMSSFETNEVSLWPHVSDGDEAVPITVSAPAKPVADRDAPAAVDWHRLDSIHSEIPEPPQMRNLPK